MTGPQFIATRAGRTYYEVTLPNMIQQLSRIADLLGLLVESVEKQQENPTPKGCCGGYSRKG